MSSESAVRLKKKKECSTYIPPCQAQKQPPPTVGTVWKKMEFIAKRERGREKRGRGREKRERGREKR